MRITFHASAMLGLFIVLWGQLCLAAPIHADPATDQLAAALAEDDGAGVQAAVVVDGGVVWSAALGHADLEQGVSMTPRTRLRIGSVSKVFTAAVAARLAADGALDVDAPIQRYVTEFPQHDEGAITARRLAAHTSGIRHYDFSNLQEANNQVIYPSLADTLSVFADDPLVAPPGTEFHYSSFGFNLLGVATERAAEQSFLESLATRVTGPLGLDDTMGDESLAVVPNRGRFYTLRPDGVLINTLWRDSSDYYPSGGLLSTAEDLARFAWEAFEGDPFEADAFAGIPRRLFTTPASLDAGDSTGSPLGYTFGWQVEHGDDGGVLWYGHGGLTNGATAEVRYDPRRRLAVAVIANYNFWFAGQPAVIRVALEGVPAVLDLPADTGTDPDAP